MKKRTKIIATLGPASTSPSKIEGMLNAGADVFRINLSHASIDDAKRHNFFSENSRKENRETSCNHAGPARTKSKN